MMNRLLKNHINRLTILISTFILGMVGINLLFADSASADWFSQLSTKYSVYTQSGDLLYWNGKDNEWKIITTSIPEVHFNGQSCDTADSNLRFDGSTTYWNCSGLVITAHTNSTFFEEGNLAYRIADFDSREKASVSGGRITKAGSLSQVTITNGGKNASSASYGCSGGNPNRTEDCSILVIFNYGYGESFNLNLQDTNYLPSQHEFYYDFPSMGEYRTLTFDPNGGSVTDASDGTALLPHPSGANALREYVKGDTAKKYPMPTRQDYTFQGWYTQRSGGSLANSTLVMNKKETYYAHWTQAPPPPQWSIIPGISVSTPTAGPGQVVSWTHWIYNNGPDATSTVNYKWQNSGGLSGEGGASSFSGLVSHGTNNVPTSPPHTVTQDDVGKNLCRSTYAKPYSNAIASEIIAGPACVSIPYNYTLTPSVSLDHTGAIDAGTSYIVTPVYVDNSGPTKSETAQWKLIKKVTSVADVTVDSGTGLVFQVGRKYLSNYPDTVPDLPVGTRICYVLSVNPGSSSAHNWVDSPPACVVIGKKPKTQIWGGDLWVGGNVKTSTSTKAGHTFGSWAEYGILASGGISGAASGAAFAGPGYSGASTSTCEYNKLSFTSAGSSSCVNNSTPIGNYTNAADMPNVAASFPGGSPINSPAISPNALGGIHTVGNLTLNPGINLNKTVVIKSSGTVTISGDQTYKDGPYTDVNQLPQLVIIANKIIINSGVQRVDAWLVATQNLDSSIKTCEIQGKSTSQCATKLVVNGPVMTNHLYLWRTAGSGVGAASGDPAEVFNLRADAYLWAIAHASTKSYIQTVYNTELPPRL